MTLPPSDASGQGSCLLYDNYSFSVFMCSACLVSKAASLVTFIASAVASRRSTIPDLTAEEEREKNVEVHVNNAFNLETDSVTRTRI